MHGKCTFSRDTRITLSAYPGYVIILASLTAVLHYTLTVFFTLYVLINLLEQAVLLPRTAAMMKTTTCVGALQTGAFETSRSALAEECRNKVDTFSAVVPDLREEIQAKLLEVSSSSNMAVSVNSKRKKQSYLYTNTLQTQALVRKDVHKPRIYRHIVHNTPMHTDICTYKTKFNRRYRWRYTHQLYEKLHNKTYKSLLQVCGKFKSYILMGQCLYVLTSGQYIFCRSIRYTGYNHVVMISLRLSSTSQSLNVVYGTESLTYERAQ